MEREKAKSDAFHKLCTFRLLVSTIMLRAILITACAAGAAAFTAPAALPGRIQARRATSAGKFLLANLSTGCPNKVASQI